MGEQYVVDQSGEGLSKEAVCGALDAALAEQSGAWRRVLLIVPDYTRYHSNAGMIANHLYHRLLNCRVDLLTALGTHTAMTREACADMYGDIPFERFMPHDWRNDVVRLGEVPADFIQEVSDGLMHEPAAVEVNRRLLQGYDQIISIGQVVPHEVVGMANHAKNIFVGCGGAAMINFSHMLGAFYGMERVMGKDHSPVRKVFDKAAQMYLAHLPISYILTVTTAPGGGIRTHGLFIGKGRQGFERAVALSREKNLTMVDKPIQRAVVYLDGREFKSTWLGNKAIYRTRMAMADGGELIVLAPGVEKFGEDAVVDGLIRKYGYCGREKVIGLCQMQNDLQSNLSAAAHLIHGSADGRFRVTYCTRLLSRQEVEGVGYAYMPYEEAVARYAPLGRGDGYQMLSNGEAVYYIQNPALGLWAYKGRFT